MLQPGPADGAENFLEKVEVIKQAHHVPGIQDLLCHCILTSRFFFFFFLSFPTGIRVEFKTWGLPDRHFTA
jgi:hypothetical protein